MKTLVITLLLAVSAFNVAAFSDSAELVDANTLLVSEDSNRPGGDACGSFGGETGYKKTINLDGNKVTIKESFRCFLFKKYVFSFACELK